MPTDLEVLHHPGYVLVILDGKGEPPASCRSLISGFIMKTTRRGRTACLIVLALWATGPAAGWSQQGLDLFGQESELVGEAQEGILSLPFLGFAALALTLATILSAVIAYHPATRRAVDTLEAIEAPKTYLMYAVVGAMIGVMVLEYGTVVGFVIFGIGGLIRFRTSLPSATKTGRLIFVTLIGLSAGLNLPALALFATGFGFVLIYILDAQITYRMDVKAVKEKHMTAAADAYRGLLEQQGYRILHERKKFSKEEIEFIFRTKKHIDRGHLEHVFRQGIPEELRGAVDWELG